LWFLLDFLSLKNDANVPWIRIWISNTADNMSFLNSGLQIGSGRNIYGSSATHYNRHPILARTYPVSSSVWSCTWCTAWSWSWSRIWRSSSSHTWPAADATAREGNNSCSSCGFISRKKF
jgi:hypothetical protein